MINLFIDMKNTAKERPRFGKNGVVYTPQKTKDAEDIIGWTLKSYMQKNNLKMSRQPVHIELAFLEVRGDHALPYPTRYDLDNAVKTIMDALNGVVYLDDTQVISIKAEKKWSIISGVNIFIQEESFQ